MNITPYKYSHNSFKTFQKLVWKSKNKRNAFLEKIYALDLSTSRYPWPKTVST